MCIWICHGDLAASQWHVLISIIVYMRMEGFFLPYRCSDSDIYVYALWECIPHDVCNNDNDNNIIHVHFHILFGDTFLFHICTILCTCYNNVCEVVVVVVLECFQCIIFPFYKFFLTFFFHSHRIANSVRQ